MLLYSNRTNEAPQVHIEQTPIVRSRIWTDDIIQNWNSPITGGESVDERAQRYMMYFTLSKTQLRCIYDRFLSEINLGLELHRRNPKASWDGTKCSLKMKDTYILESQIPKGSERCVTVALEFGGSEAHKARAVRVQLANEGRILTKSVIINLRDKVPEYPKGLLDRNATASKLFDSLALLTLQLQEETGMKRAASDPQPVGFAACFPVDQRGMANADLMHWCKGFETGRTTKDPVEGMDVAALLDCAFLRNKVNAKTSAVLNDTTGTLLAGCYEKGSTLPPCRVGFVLASGVNGCYIQPDAADWFGYKGSVINCELGCFDKGLPVNDVDLEVDFADAATEGVQLFEKMTATTYLSELCRRVVVKVWQSSTPKLAWVRNSLPWVACARIIEDESENLDITEEILNGLWEWQTTVADRKLIINLFNAIFDRSAALVAVAMAVIATKTGRLQQAMGGLTCAVTGPLFAKCSSYQQHLKKYLSRILDEETANLITLFEVQDGAIKGAGILAAMIKA